MIGSKFVSDKLFLAVRQSVLLMGRVRNINTHRKFRCVSRIKRTPIFILIKSL